MKKEEKDGGTVKYVIIFSGDKFVASRESLLGNK